MKRFVITDANAPQNRRKTKFTIIDETELEEIRRTMIKLQQRVRELEKEKLQQRISPTQQRISPTQKRQSPSSLPTQLQQRVREKNKKTMTDLQIFYDKLESRLDNLGT